MVVVRPLLSSIGRFLWDKDRYTLTNTLSVEKALIWPLFFCYGFYAAIAEGTQRAFVADVVGEENRGAAFGLFAACVGLALLPASLIAGFLWDRFGPQAPFYYGTATAAAAAVLMLFVPYRKPAAASVSVL